MKSLTYILFLLVSLSLSSCEKGGSDCCTVIDTALDIHYVDQSGLSLINSTDAFDQSNIKVYYKDGDAYEYVYNNNLDAPNMHTLYEDADGNTILRVFTSYYYEGNESTTLIELNENTVDTLRCRYDLSDNREVLTDVWFNGQKMTDEGLVIIK